MPNDAQHASAAAGPESHTAALRSRNELPEALEQRLAAIEARLTEPRATGVSGKTVALIGSLIATAIPVATAIDGYLRWRTDLAVTAQQQMHSARMDTLKTVLSAELPELERESRLRLLTAMVEPGDAIHIWAEAELGRVEKTIEQLKAENAAALRELASWSEKAASAAHEIERIDGPGAVPRPRAEQTGASTGEGSAVEPASGVGLGAAVGRGKPAPVQAVPPELAKPSKSVAVRQEYLTARRKSDVAAIRANATAKRLSGIDSVDARALEKLAD